MPETFMALGTMGWVPSERRESNCHALGGGSTFFVFDCGTGARRLAHPELAPVIGASDDIAIILSHYHLDHTIGITFLPELLEGRKVTIAGPSSEITGIGLHEALSQLTARPLFSMPIDKFPMDLKLVELREGDNELGGRKISVRKQKHTDPSIGIRVDDVIAYITDTPCDDGTVEFVEEVAMLLHECWLDDEDYEREVAAGGDVLNVHSHVAGVTEIANEAGVDMLALSHLNPRYREGRLRRMEQAARRRFQAAAMLHDFQQFNLET